MKEQVQAIRGPVLTYSDEHAAGDPRSNINYFADAIIMLTDGVITAVGPAYQFAGHLPSDSAITQSTSCRIIKVSPDA
ncbi:MAG: hypothetical protein CBC79_02550 [Gammaproteobacteria bacterium TMED119]|nr:MAG: hypothetical protein CBC79_02550 [Gammaproteobacteria bacterium TMED119]RCL46551.1 MAG: hypothetical protein DBW91_02090 [Candidatus Thioglobus sp.]|tara:strand:- start:2554 stop:2787 length:234 start_codon:yes stop_codon:yes gene_type:complete